MVHFDGHGTWADGPLAARRRIDARMASARRARLPAVREPRGLGQHRACRRAASWASCWPRPGAGAGAQRLPLRPRRPSTRPTGRTTALADVHTRVRAYGSLAQEVVDAGVAGVVAMRYNVYVVTAAQFVADLYAALLAASRSARRCHRGRKQLAASPTGRSPSRPARCRTGSCPVVYEAAPLALFPTPRGDEQLHITMTPAQAGRERGRWTRACPPRRTSASSAATRPCWPSTGPSTPAGRAAARLRRSGKTTTAAEFARWYAQTGGIEGPVLFTSFEHHIPLGAGARPARRGLRATLEAAGSTG